MKNLDSFIDFPHIWFTSISHRTYHPSLGPCHHHPFSISVGYMVVMVFFSFVPPVFCSQHNSPNEPVGLEAQTPWRSTRPSMVQPHLHSEFSGCVPCLCSPIPPGLPSSYSAVACLSAILLKFSKGYNNKLLQLLAVWTHNLLYSQATPWEYKPSLTLTPVWILLPWSSSIWHATIFFLFVLLRVCPFKQNACFMYTKETHFESSKLRGIIV